MLQERRQVLQKRRRQVILFWSDKKRGARVVAPLFLCLPTCTPCPGTCLTAQTPVCISPTESLTPAPQTTITHRHRPRPPTNQPASLRPVPRPSESLTPRVPNHHHSPTTHARRAMPHTPPQPRFSSFFQNFYQTICGFKKKAYLCILISMGA